METTVILLADDISGSGNIWLSVLGLLSIIITVIIGPNLSEYVKARIARRNGASVTVAPGLNAPLDPHTPGVTGMNIQAMFSTVADMQIRLDKAEAALIVAHSEIADLQHDAEFYKFVLEQVIHWGSTDPGTPPRSLPEGIKALLQRGGWI